MDIQLDIVTPEKQAFSGRISQAVIPGWVGQFGVLPQHDNFLALAKAGVATLWTTDGERKFVIGRGFAEVTSTFGKTNETRVTLLTEVCEAVSGIDKEKARKELADAEKALSETEAGSERWRVAQARVDLARVRVEA